MIRFLLTRMEREGVAMKRFLSILIALCLAVALFPMTVLAMNITEVI